MTKDPHDDDASSGSEKLEALFNHYRRLMMHIAYGITRNKELAEEVMQDALLKMLLKIDRVGTIGSPRTTGWVILVTRHAAIDKMKYEARRRHDGSDVLEEEPAVFSLESTAMMHIAFDMVQNKLKKMGKDDFEMVMLRYYYGYSDAKLAERYSISPELVRKRCERARKRLLSQFDPEQ